MSQFFLGSTNPMSAMNPLYVLSQNIKDSTTQNPTTQNPTTQNPTITQNQNSNLPPIDVDITGEKEKGFLEGIGETAQSLADQAIIEASRLGKSNIDYDAPFAIIGDKSFFTTDEGKTGTSDLGAVQRELLRQSKMNPMEAREARKTGEFILGTVAPAPEVDGPLPQSIVDPDDPSKTLRRLYSPITGGLLDQYGDRTAQESLLSTVNPATGKLFVEEQRVQDVADDKFKTFQQFAASTPQTYATTQEDLDAKKASSRALQESIAQKDAARNLAQRARTLGMKPEELMVMETPAPAPQQSMYGAAQLIKALEGFPEAQSAVAKQFGVPDSTPTADTKIRDLMARPPKEPEGTMTPRPKPQTQSVGTSALNISPAAEGSAQANSYIDRLLQANPEATRDSIIDILRRQGIIFTPQQTTR